MCVFNFSLAFAEHRNLLTEEVILLLGYECGAAGRYLSLACQSCPRGTAYIPYCFSPPNISPFLLSFIQAYPDQDTQESQPVSRPEDLPWTNFRDTGKQASSRVTL